MFSLKSVVNSRELGGYRLPDGRTVRQGLLLRGGSLAKASDEDIAALENEYHLSKIFDFRTKTEVEMAPDREVNGARNIWMPAFNEATLEMNNMALPKEAYSNLGEWLLVNGNKPEIYRIASRMYLEIITNEFSQIQYAGFLQNIVATDDGAVFWHCSQGKDRTGLASAYILAALGADRKLIMEDFALSNKRYQVELDALLPRAANEEHRSVIKTFIGANCEYFKNGLDYIDATWGSMKDFLMGPLCLSEEDMEILRNRYLV